MRSTCLNDEELQALSEDSEAFIDKASKKLRRRTRRDLLRWTDLWSNKPKLDQVYGVLWPKLLQAEKDTKEWEKSIDERKQSAILNGTSVSTKVESEISEFEARINFLDDLANDCLQLHYDANNEISETMAVLIFHSEVMIQGIKETHVPKRDNSTRFHSSEAPPAWGVPSPQKRSTASANGVGSSALSSKEVSTADITSNHENSVVSSVNSLDSNVNSVGIGSHNDIPTGAVITPSNASNKEDMLEPKSLLSELLATAVSPQPNREVTIDAIHEYATSSDSTTGMSATQNQLSPSSNDFYPNDTPAVWPLLGVGISGLSPTKSPVGIQMMKSYFEDSITEVPGVHLSLSPTRTHRKRASGGSTLSSSPISPTSSTSSPTQSSPTSSPQSPCEAPGSPFGVDDTAINSEIISSPSLNSKSPVCNDLLCDQNDVGVNYTPSNCTIQSFIADAKEVTHSPAVTAVEVPVPIPWEQTIVEQPSAAESKSTHDPLVSSLSLELEALTSASSSPPGHEDENWVDANQRRHLLTSKSVDLRNVSIPLSSKTSPPLGVETRTLSPHRKESPALSPVDRSSRSGTSPLKYSERSGSNSGRRRSHSHSSYLESQSSRVEALVQSTLSYVPDIFLKVIIKDPLYEAITEYIAKLQSIKDQLIPVQKAIAQDRELETARLKKLKNQRSEFQRVFQMMTSESPADTAGDPQFGRSKIAKFPRVQSNNSSNGSVELSVQTKRNRPTLRKMITSKFLSAFGNARDASDNTNPRSRKEESPDAPSSGGYFLSKSHSGLFSPSPSLPKSPSGNSLSGFYDHGHYVASSSSASNSGLPLNLGMLRTLSGNQVLSASILSPSEDFHVGILDASDSGDSGVSVDGGTHGSVTRDCIDEIKLVLEQESKVSEQKSIISSLVQSVSAAQKQLFDSKDAGRGLPST